LVADVFFYIVKLYRAAKLSNGYWVKWDTCVIQEFGLDRSFGADVTYLKAELCQAG